MEMEYFRPFFISMYCAVFLVASSGNFLVSNIIFDFSSFPTTVFKVVYVVMTNKRMQTITNIFITNLAVSDIMVNFTWVFFEIGSDISGSYIQIVVAYTNIHLNRTLDIRRWIVSWFTPVPRYWFTYRREVKQ